MNIALKTALILSDDRVKMIANNKDRPAPPIQEKAETSNVISIAPFLKRNLTPFGGDAA